MKRVFWALAMALPMLFVACNKDDDQGNKNSIIGLWELTKAYIEEDDRWWYAEEDMADLYQLEVSNDDSGKFTHYSSFDIVEEPFTWQVVDDQFRLVLPDKKYQAYKIERISNDELVLVKDLVISYYKRRK